jgi:hypothetical protein
MSMRSPSKRYINLHPDGRENIPWYWRSIALAASWMILGGYVSPFKTLPLKRLGMGPY